MSDCPQTPEDLILQMSREELQELLVDMGFDAGPGLVDGIRRLVEELGSLEAAVIALTDEQLHRRVA